MVIFPSPAEGSIKPAAAGVQALTMNSPGSAWTPVLAGLKQLIGRRRKTPKPKPARYTLYRTGTKYRSGQLEQCARARSLSVRLVERACIVLLAAEGKQDKDVAAELGITAQKVARWRKRFLALGMAGLEKDAPRPGRTPSISASKVKRVIQKTTQEKPAHRTQWSTRSMAAVGLSEATVRRIWHKNGPRFMVLRS
jgi:transposase